MWVSFHSGCWVLVSPFSLETSFNSETFSWMRLLIISFQFLFSFSNSFYWDNGPSWPVFWFSHIFFPICHLFFFLLYFYWVSMYYHVFDFQELLSLGLLNNICPVLVTIVLSLSCLIPVWSVSSSFSFLSCYLFGLYLLCCSLSLDGGCVWE